MTSEPSPAVPGSGRAEGVEPGIALPISSVAARTGLSQATLRMWQQRYGLGPTRTTPGGHRRYGREDIERLEAVQALVHRGVSTGDAARAVLAAAQHGIPLPAHADPIAHRVCAAALDLDGPTVRWLLRDHLARTDAVTTWETVVRPVLGPIGECWERLPHGIAVEHLLSHITEVVLGGAGEAPSRTNPAPVLLACVPGEEHDLPLTALAAALGRAAVPSTMLGAGLSADALAEAARGRAGVMVLYAHVAELADPTILDRLAGAAVLVAAGPGWDGVGLPRDVEHVNDLAAATAAVTARVG